MVIGVALQFEEHIISETMGCVPTVENGNFLVLAIGQFLFEGGRSAICS